MSLTTKKMMCKFHNLKLMKIAWYHRRELNFQLWVRQKRGKPILAKTNGATNLCHTIDVLSRLLVYPLNSSAPIKRWVLSIFHRFSRNQYFEQYWRRGIYEFYVSSLVLYPLLFQSLCTLDTIISQVNIHFESYDEAIEKKKEND